MPEINSTFFYKFIKKEKEGSSGETRSLYDENGKEVGFVISTRYRPNIKQNPSGEYYYEPYEVFKSFNIKPGAIEGLEGGGIVGTRWTNVNDEDVVGTPIYTQGIFNNVKDLKFTRRIIQEVQQQSFHFINF